MLTSDPAVESETGGFYRAGKRRARPLHFDPEVSRRVSRASAELCGVDA